MAHLSNAASAAAAADSAICLLVAVDGIASIAACMPENAASALPFISTALDASYLQHEYMICINSIASVACLVLRCGTRCNTTRFSLWHLVPVLVHRLLHVKLDPEFVPILLEGKSVGRARQSRPQCHEQQGFMHKRPRVKTVLTNPCLP